MRERTIVFTPAWRSSMRAAGVAAAAAGRRRQHVSTARRRRAQGLRSSATSRTIAPVRSRSEALGIALFTRVASDDPTALIGLPLIRADRHADRRGHSSAVTGRARRCRQAATCCPTCSARSSRRRCCRRARWPSRGGLRHFVVETPKAARAFVKSLPSEHPLQRHRLRRAERAHAGDETCRALLAPVAWRVRTSRCCRDAGCPGVADPGAPLVAAAHARSALVVVPLVGPSALLLALMASGTERPELRRFTATCPCAPKRAPRRCGRWTPRAARSGATQLFIETPYRNEAIVAAVLAVMPATDAVLRRRRSDLAVRTDRQAHGGAWRTAPTLRLSGRPAMFLLGRD